jgi:hypothetical protein
MMVIFNKNPLIGSNENHHNIRTTGDLCGS